MTVITHCVLYLVDLNGDSLSDQRFHASFVIDRDNNHSLHILEEIQFCFDRDANGCLIKIIAPTGIELGELSCVDKPVLKGEQLFLFVNPISQAFAEWRAEQHLTTRN